MELSPLEQMIAEVPVAWRLVLALSLALPLSWGLWATRHDVS